MQSTENNKEYTTRFSHLKQIIIPDSSIDCSYLIVKLHQILDSLFIEKQAFEDRLINQRTNFQEKLLKQQAIIQQIQLQNLSKNTLIDQLNCQLTEKNQEIQSLKQRCQSLSKRLTSVTSVMRYLQQKNKQANYQLYQIKKISNVKSTKELLLDKIIKPEGSNKYLPRYIFHHTDQHSIFDYTGINIDQDISINQLHRTQSSPNLDAQTIATQVDTASIPSNLRSKPKLRSPSKHNYHIIRNVGHIFENQLKNSTQQTVKIAKKGSLQKKERSNLTMQQKKKSINAKMGKTHVAQAQKTKTIVTKR